MKTIILAIALSAICRFAIAAEDPSRFQYRELTTAGSSNGAGECGKAENSRGCSDGRKITSDDIDAAVRNAPTYDVVPTVFPRVEYIRR